LFQTKTNVIIVCDSGQETVVAADLSGDAAMTKSVLEGADLHCLLARVLFPEIADLTDDEIVKGHKEKEMHQKHLDLLCLMEVMHLQYILMKEFH
jgi:hypothetical protein